MSQVVIIAGMHRSGTSMIARLLNLCGVYLGPDSDLWNPQPDNLEGFWENRQFVSLNDELLVELGSGWDFPPKFGSHWSKSDRFMDLQSRAKELIQQFSHFENWGWKDPRNSFTLSFWKELIPSARVIICVRNPLEVANSLLHRNNHSRALALNLWVEYNQRVLLDSEPGHRIITHYDAYFHDPFSELTRILKFLELEVPESRVRQCLETVNARLRHNQFAFSDLALDAPDEVLDLYQKMCDQSTQDELSRKSETMQEDMPDPQNTELRLRSLSVRLESLKKLLKEKERDIHMLTTQLQERENDLAEIYRSKAWHFVQKVRRTRQKILG